MREPDGQHEIVVEALSDQVTEAVRSGITAKCRPRTDGPHIVPQSVIRSSGASTQLSTTSRTWRIDQSDIVREALLRCARLLSKFILYRPIQIAFNTNLDRRTRRTQLDGETKRVR